MPMATATVTATAADPRPGLAEGCRFRAVYRSSGGEIHFNWPVERVAEAIADGGGTLWLDVENCGNDPAPVEALFRDVFNFHPLAIEDALSESHVPKVDDWERYLYLVFHAVEFNPETDRLRLLELDTFLGVNYLVTYHVEPLPFLDRLLQALGRDDGSRLKRGPDHVLYNVLDLGVDEYLEAIQHLDDAIDAAQDEVFRNPTRATLQGIFRIKRAATKLQRVIAPLREVANRLARDVYTQIDAPDRVYFRDIYDHLVRLHAITEGLRDLIAGALDTYLSAISNRTNDIMKTLTLVNVMFLPMSFLAGFFGMNFFGETLAFHSALPRLGLFCFTVGVMALTPAVMWTWAKRRGWF
jgi:magnesium transporter